MKKKWFVLVSLVLLFFICLAIGVNFSWVKKGSLQPNKKVISFELPAEFDQQQYCQQPMWICVSDSETLICEYFDATSAGTKSLFFITDIGTGATRTLVTEKSRAKLINEGKWLWLMPYDKTKQNYFIDIKTLRKVGDEFDYAKMSVSVSGKQLGMRTPENSVYYYQIGNQHKKLITIKPPDSIESILPAKNRLIINAYDYDKYEHVIELWDVQNSKLLKTYNCAGGVPEIDSYRYYKEPIAKNLLCYYTTNNEYHILDLASAKIRFSIKPKSPPGKKEKPAIVFSCSPEFVKETQQLVWIEYYPPKFDEGKIVVADVQTGKEIRSAEFSNFIRNKKPALLTKISSQWYILLEKKKMFSDDFGYMQPVNLSDFSVLPKAEYRWANYTTLKSVENGFLYPSNDFSVVLVRWTKDNKKVE